MEEALRKSVDIVVENARQDVIASGESENRSSRDFCEGRIVFELEREAG